MATRSRKKAQAIAESTEAAKVNIPVSAGSGSEVVHTTETPAAPKGKTFTPKGGKKKSSAKPKSEAQKRAEAEETRTPTRFPEAPAMAEGTRGETVKEDVDPDTGRAPTKVGIENILSVTRPLLPGEQGPKFKWEKGPKGTPRGNISTHQKVVAVPELAAEVHEAANRLLGIDPRRSSGNIRIKNPQHVKDLEDLAGKEKEAFAKVTEAKQGIATAKAAARRAKSNYFEIVKNKDKFAGLPAEDVLSEIQGRRAAHEAAQQAHEDAVSAHADALDAHKDAQAKFAYAWANATGQVVPYTRGSSKGAGVRQTGGAIDPSMVGPSKAVKEAHAAEQAISRITGRRAVEFGEEPPKTLVDSAVDESTNEHVYGTPSYLSMNELKRSHRPGRGKKGTSSDIFGSSDLLKSVQQEALGSSHIQAKIRGEQLRQSIEMHLTKASHYAKHGTTGMADADSYKPLSEKDIDYLKNLHHAVGEVYGRGGDDVNESPCEEPGCPHFSKGFNNEYCTDHGGKKPILATSHLGPVPSAAKPVPMPAFSSAQGEEDTRDEIGKSLQATEQAKKSLFETAFPKTSPGRAEILRGALAQQRRGEQVAAEREAFVAQPKTALPEGLVWGPTHQIQGIQARAEAHERNQKTAAVESGISTAQGNIAFHQSQLDRLRGPADASGNVFHTLRSGSKSAVQGGAVRPGTDAHSAAIAHHEGELAKHQQLLKGWSLYGSGEAATPPETAPDMRRRTEFDRGVNYNFSTADVKVD